MRAKIHNLVGAKFCLFKFAIFSISVYYIIILTWIILNRITYPFELEWMEGGTVEHIIRLLEGKKIYSSPTLEFIPYLYTPFYYYLGMLFSSFFGIGFFSLRLISVLSIVGICFVIYRIIFEETKSIFWAIVGFALFLACYGISGFWFDLARVDMLANFFTLLGFYFLLKEKPHFLYLSIMCSFLAFYTKQSQLLIIGIFILPLIRKSFKKFIVYSIFLFTIIFLSTLIENYISNGWYFFWNFTLPATHHWVWDRAISFWTIEILPYFSIGFLLSLSLVFHKSQWQKERNSFYFALFIGSLINSYILRLHYGGYSNVFIPLILSISILLPIASRSLQEGYIKTEIINKLIFLALIIQFLLLLYKPNRAIPKKEDLKTGWEFIEHLKNINGEVFIPGHCFISRYAGKKSYTHYVLMNDLFITQRPEKNDLYRQWENALEQGKFSAIILDQNITLPLLEDHYYYSRKIITESYFATPTGKTNPIQLYLPTKKLKSLQ